MLHKVFSKNSQLGKKLELNELWHQLDKLTQK